MIKKYIKELLLFLIVLIFIILVKSYVVTPIIVKGNSMYKTLYGKEYMILNRLSEINRYDIVVLESDNKRLIKRVYGLPGERISIEDNIIYINNNMIEDIYAYGDTSNFDSITLGEDEYFVLGDNRAVALDSRTIGPIKRNKIKGTTNFIVYPFNRFGKLK